MRLIDADAIEINEECTFSGKGIKSFLNAIPTAYDVDKVVSDIDNNVPGITNMQIMMIQDIIKSDCIE